MALLATKDPGFHPYIVKARSYIATCQLNQGKKGGIENIFDGGIGYGTQNHPDMHSTCIALEAIKSSQFLESGNRAAAYGTVKTVKMRL